MPDGRPNFSATSIKFLRAIKRNNKREWFHARRAEYDAHVHAPMVAVVEQLALDLARVAPQFVASPKVSMFRPFRDTRFSTDKTPLKTNVAATFPHRALGRMQGAGLYFEVGPDYVWIGGGLYAPDSPSLHAVRAHIADHHRTLAGILKKPAFIRLLGTMTGDRISRVPRGFDAAHPAADFLRHKQFIASREETAEFATRPDFYPKLLATFVALTPLVLFLDEPLIALKRVTERDPLLREDDGRPGRARR